MEEERPRKKVRFAEAVTRSMRRKLSIAFRSQDKKKVIELLNITKKDINEKEYSTAVIILLSDINTNSKIESAYNSEFATEIIENIISIFGKSIFCYGYSGFNFIKNSQNKSNQISNKFREDVANALISCTEDTQTSDNKERIDLAEDISKDDSSSKEESKIDSNTKTNNHCINPITDEQKKNTQNNNLITKSQNYNNHTPSTLTSIIDEYFAWIYSLPEFLQAIIKNTNIYYIKLQSMDASLRILNTPDISFEIFNSKSESINQKPEETEQDLSVFTNNTQALIDTEMTYDGHIPIKIEQVKLLDDINLFAF